MEKWIANWSGAVENFPGLQSIVFGFEQAEQYVKDHVADVEQLLIPYCQKHAGKNISVAVEGSVEEHGEHSATITVGVIPKATATPPAEGSPESSPAPESGAPPEGTPEPIEPLGESSGEPESAFTPPGHQSEAPVPPQDELESPVPPTTPATSTGITAPPSPPPAEGTPEPTPLTTPSPGSEAA